MIIIMITMITIIRTIIITWPNTASYVHWNDLLPSLLVTPNEVSLLMSTTLSTPMNMNRSYNNQNNDNYNKIKT